MESGGGERRAERLRPLQLPLHHGGGDGDAWCVPVVLLRMRAAKQSSRVTEEVAAEVAHLFNNFNVQDGATSFIPAVEK